ncbi:MAG: hypothetical protein SGBAC_011669 [Bacillariaceae sp.]
MTSNNSNNKQELYSGDFPEPEVQEGRSRAFCVFAVLCLVVVAVGGVTYAAIPSVKPSSSEAAATSTNVAPTAHPTSSPVARITPAPSIMATKSSGSEDCNSGQQLVEFFIQLDQDSNHETGWSLQCSEEEVWNVAVGVLEETKEFREGNQMIQSACVDDTETYEFTIHDSYGDGLVEGNGDFYLRYGAATVATYEMTQGECSEKKYCFGPNCNQDPVEITDECARIYLAIGLDANPQEVTYQVECNDEVVLQGPWGEHEPFDTLEEETCMPMNSCCRFTVTDTGGDGLTATEGGEYGWIYLEYGMDLAYGYTGDDDGAFAEDGTTFGYGCEQGGI